MPSKVSAQHALFYSQITFAMNAARMVKVLLLLNKDEINRTQREVVTFAQASMIINAAKLWDKSHYSIKRHIDRHDIRENERNQLLTDMNAIRKKHKNIIDRLLSWRHTLIVHLSAQLTDQEFFEEFNNFEIADFQEMIEDVVKLVSSTSWFYGSQALHFLDYDSIATDLSVTLRHDIA
jgi:hypothetical protein